MLFRVSIFRAISRQALDDIIMLQTSQTLCSCFRFLYAKSASLNSRMSSPTLWYKKMSLNSEYLPRAAFVLSLLHLSQAIGKFLIPKCDPNPYPLQKFTIQPFQFNFPSGELAKGSKMYLEYVNYSNFKMSDDSHVSIQISSNISHKYWAI